jgi:hypothetical protein
VSEVREKVMTLLFEQQCRDSKLSAVTPAAEQVKITGINWNKLVYNWLEPVLSCLKLPVQVYFVFSYL